VRADINAFWLPNCPIVFVASSSHSRSASSAISSTALKNFTAFGLGLPNGRSLPHWWELQYFGHTGVDPKGNPAGDGWSNVQKFQNGRNPNVFYTPPAPQGLAVTKIGAIIHLCHARNPCHCGIFFFDFGTQIADFSGNLSNFCKV
jgi:hypothetical protein